MTLQHLAIVPDGNRRWAKQHKLEAIFGHKSGADAAKHAIEVCLENEIKYLSFYTFSLENFKRDDVEKTYFFNLMAQQIREMLPLAVDQGIKIIFIGDRTYFPAHLLDVIAQTETQTAHGKRLQFNALFCYGARHEMVHAARSLAHQVALGHIKPEDIDEKMLGNSLWTRGIPDPDLIIRTGKELRLSNLLLFQAAYSELMFLDCYWPEMTKERLQQCLDNFAMRKRNFGK